MGNGKKIIYLTFDDGPSNDVTNKVLDILKENNVKGTFFLIGNQIDDCKDVVLRIHSEGHSMGLHTYTHKFKRIYSNKNAFIKEMLKCNDKIKEVTGVSSNIIRFPGGSQKHLTNSFVEKLHSCNFKIYDWNMETVDGLMPKASPDRLYREATKGSEDLSNIILLLHCDYTHKNTCRALPRIIKYYKDKGYEFKSITDDTPELYFPIKNKR
jgi:peptidoglycan/xylan/chitin deacetylase (PgdA/CDA1 family)